MLHHVQSLNSCWTTLNLSVQVCSEVRKGIWAMIKEYNLEGAMWKNIICQGRDGVKDHKHSSHKYTTISGWLLKTKGIKFCKHQYRKITSYTENNQNTANFNHHKLHSCKTNQQLIMPMSTYQLNYKLTWPSFTSLHIWFILPPS